MQLPAPSGRLVIKKLLLDEKSVTVVCGLEQYV
jgi:hypothetical protein